MLHAILEVTQQPRTGTAIAQMLSTEPAPLEANPTPHNVVLPDISAQVPDIHMAAIVRANRHDTSPHLAYDDRMM